jgi:phenylpyruvate tautomerase PptA (4-oxalocrotonate tautomerase family)
MAQIKIHARRAHIDRVRPSLSDAIHGVMMETLGLPEDKRFHRFIALDDTDFIHPADRGDGYTVIEILMFEGRSEDAKRACLRGLMRAIPEATGVAVEAVEITIIETPMANWGIRGKIGDELVLNYKVAT